MKNVILILALSGLAFLAGCKEKEEPAMPGMDMSKTVKETTGQAQQAAGEAQKTAAEAQKTTETAVTAAMEQTKCPILPNNPIDKNVFVEYKGKKVYFCCQDCVAEFNKNPEKYISQLPQFKQ